MIGSGRECCEIGEKMEICAPKPWFEFKPVSMARPTEIPIKPGMIVFWGRLVTVQLL